MDAPIQAEEKEKRPKNWAKFIAMWLFILLMALGIARAGKLYRDTLQEKRGACLNMTIERGLDLTNLEVKALYAEVQLTNWLPRLNELCVSLEKMSARLGKRLPGNPESGSYLDYIKRHEKPFDEKEALEWQTRAVHSR